MLSGEAKKVVPVILSGGAGTRLWPLSRQDRPKQFYGLKEGSDSLLAATIRRVSDPAIFHPPLLLGNREHRFLIAEQMRYCGIEAPEVIVEPCIRNTGPAITAAALHIKQHHPHALMLVLPTDQHIANCQGFMDGIERALSVAKKGYLVTLGITPDYAETGYGYIRRGAPFADGEKVFEVASFVEKPNRQTAERYVAEGNYLWNSGMFLFPCDTLLEEMRHLNPEILQSCREALDRAAGSKEFIQLDEASFAKAPDISIDYALMERTRRAALVPLDCGWSDTGAWESLWRITNKDGDGNVVIGDCHALESQGCYLRNEKGPLIAAYGVDDLVIVATKDAVLVTHKDKAQSVKSLVEHIRQNNPRLVAQNCQVYRPWGMYESINSGPRHQVKRIHVKPGEKLSLQMHYHRAEHWVIVSGTAKVVCGDKESLLTENQSVFIPNGSVHRIENPGKIDLEIIEVQSGPYLGEDDIVRFEDDYGRISEAG